MELSSIARNIVAKTDNHNVRQMTIQHLLLAVNSLVRSTVFTVDNRFLDERYHFTNKPQESN